MEESDWATALAARRGSGLPVYDLTASNPTTCGFDYSLDVLVASGRSSALKYTPDPQGLISAREAVCSYYLDHGAVVPAAQITLTTSTSEAYSFLLRLLCDPGDEILIAQPSYPLFEYLAGLDDVKLIGYPLFYDHGWHIDTHCLRSAISERTRAIVLVHPNNPTGSFASAAERAELQALCVEFGLALIVDEVFLDYAFQEDSGSFAAAEHPALTFVLSGISKVAALPQMKLSWIAAFGPQDLLAQSLSRLTIIADTFLSLSTVQQLAAPCWLESRHHIQPQIRARVLANLARLDQILADCSLLTRSVVSGGWYVLVRTPEFINAESQCLDLVVNFGILTHPGSFFGLPGKCWLVLSLLPPADEFYAGCRLLCTNLTQAVHADHGITTAAGKDS